MSDPQKEEKYKYRVGVLEIYERQFDVEAADVFSAINSARALRTGRVCGKEIESKSTFVEFADEHDYHMSALVETKPKKRKIGESCFLGISSNALVAVFGDQLSGEDCALLVDSYSAKDTETIKGDDDILIYPGLCSVVRLDLVKKEEEA